MRPERGLFAGRQNIKVKRYTMPTVFNVANYFIVATKCDCEDGLNDDVMTHLKLQKLVYYAQGFSMVFNNEPLFDRDIEAWEHGPVCADLYNKYKKYKCGIIISNLSFDEAKKPFTQKQTGYYNVRGHEAIL
ncbi:MAG: DUF4065 domain-containing protein [Deltaproteobacteria bacterium]|jgi:uncharacterized phage-associated protein|nr:DUF4065 domain-containing protein [Deltaproteobacteria bacterium]